MKSRRLLCILLALLLALPLCVGAEGGATFPRDDYFDAMNAYYSEDYADAARLFRKAGNYEDAGMWAYYCEAIDLVIQADQGNAVDEDGNSLIDQAKARFSLLAGQYFQEAASWTIYCTGRQYEATKSTNQAAECYGKVCIHDSIARYLMCKHQLDILRSAEDVRAGMPDAPLSFPDLYDQGMNAYYRMEYTTAADYFCLAGNYEDAPLWRCYCLAIGLLVEKDGPGVLAEALRISIARALFDMLAGLRFRDAAAWATYCAARQFEADGSFNQAMELYQKVFILDSFTRYLELLPKYGR